MGVKRIKELINDKDNDFNEISLKRNNNDKINDKSMSIKSAPKIAYTDYIADKLVKIFDAPLSRNFFLKCAWHLSEDTIWSAVEDTRKKGVKKPLALFIFICNNALQERSINS